MLLQVIHGGHQAQRGEDGEENEVGTRKMFEVELEGQETDVCFVTVDSKGGADFGVVWSVSRRSEREHGGVGGEGGGRVTRARAG